MRKVEEVARAMMLACHEQDPLVGPYELPEERWCYDAAFRHYWMVLARAAIEALMEPDERMISAYFEKCAELGFTAHITATAAWQAMLSAALERENV